MPAMLEFEFVLGKKKHPDGQYFIFIENGFISLSTADKPPTEAKLTVWE